MVSGELNESVTLYDSLVNFNADEESKQFNYKVKIDDKLEPGLHTADIIALEVPKMSESGTYVGATVAVVSQLYVYVPCPGKCIDGDLNVFGAEQNSTVTFIVPVINRGKLGIGEVKAVIDIYTNLNRKIATVETDLSSISPGARTELTGKWLADVNIGEYTAKVTVLYDGESKTFEKQFSVGTNILNVESISVNDFTLGEIAKIKILVENRWNKELQGVFANLLVYNHEDQIMADIKSPNEDIPALSKKELIAYWDTVGVQEGEYVGKLMIHHGKRSADRNLILKIRQDSMEFSGIGYAISSKKGGGISMTAILVILVILLLVVNLAWFVFFNRMRRQENTKRLNRKL
jgi:hypothetical protein